MSKSGYVYVLINPSLAGLVKVGCSQRDPALRVKELSAGTGVPTPFHLAYKVRFADCAAAERHVHEILAEHRLSDKREFFKVPLEAAIEALFEAKAVLPTGDSKEKIQSGDKEISPQRENLCDEFEQAIRDAMFARSGTPQSILEGLEIARKAFEVDCINENTYGRLLLFVADLYLHGQRGFLEDPQQALSLLERAASAGLINAYQKLGDLYVEGEKVRKDLKAARQYYWEGVKLGDHSLWVSIAESYEGNDLRLWQKAWKNYFSSKHFLSPDETSSVVGDPSSNVENYLLGLDHWRYLGRIPQEVDRKDLEPIIERAKADDPFRQKLLGEYDELAASLADLRRTMVLERYDKHGDGYWNTVMTLLRNL